MFDTPLHPKLVHFPIAFIIGALVLELVALCQHKETLHRAAVTLMVMAALFSLATLVSGLLEEKRLHLKHPLLEKHELAAYITVIGSWVAVGLNWWKGAKAWFRGVWVVLLMGLTVSVLLAAHLGGLMVYKYGVGVSL